MLHHYVSTVAQKGHTKLWFGRCEQRDIHPGANCNLSARSHLILHTGPLKQKQTDPDADACFAVDLSALV